MSIERVRYELRVMGVRVILAPILTMIGFALLAALMHNIHADITRTAQVLMAGLEMMLPLAAGVIVATVSTQDGAIELQLTLPRRYSTTTFRRLALIIGLTTATALASSSIIYLLKLWRMPLELQSWSTLLQFITGQLAWL